MIRNLNLMAALAGGVILCACGGASESEAADAGVAAVSGEYKTDYKHRYITFSYDHFGLSQPLLRWRDWDAVLDWNAENPVASSVSVTIDAASADSGVDEFDEHLRGAQFFDVENHPTITFVSTSLEKTGEDTGTITGDLTIKGHTKSITLNVQMNTAFYDERRKQHKIGFSATGLVKRSDFDVDLFAPNVSDEVALKIEAEFIKPDAE